jgi:hypothetical protein
MGGEMTAKELQQRAEEGAERIKKGLGESRPALYQVELDKAADLAAIEYFEMLQLIRVKRQEVASLELQSDMLCREFENAKLAQLKFKHGVK